MRYFKVESITKLRDTFIKKFGNNKLIYYPAKQTYVIFKGVYKTLTLRKRFKLLSNQYALEVSNMNNEIGSLLVENDELNKKICELNQQVELLKLNDEISKEELKNFSQMCADEYDNIFYYHGGSGNHGCEALIKTITEINNLSPKKNCLYSFRPKEDYKFGIDKYAKYIIRSNLDASEIVNESFQKDTVALSVGGDNYCGYDYATKRLAMYNKKFNDMGVKTALIGCSIEPDALEHQEVLDDLNRFSLITARETITYKALLEKGIKTNTHLIPDSAFTLEKIELPLPEFFKEGKTIGLNVSNLIQAYEKDNDLVLQNYRKLIEYIITSTDYQIALIPHVVQSFNDDLNSLTKLYNEYKDTKRVGLISEHNCNELKGYISRCKIFIGARTHSIIAAYSSLVPTLALGYSVKSKGIARDIFGTEENYVISVQSLKNENELTNAFLWINKNSRKIKNHLEKFMPGYIEKCYNLKPLMMELKEEGTARQSLADKNLCTGCSACASICPLKCIKMVQGQDGFMAPVTDYKICNDCGLCKKICPINKDLKPKSLKKAYAAINKDELIRSKSSSGGIFDLLASLVLNDGGIVIGAAYDKNNNVSHMWIKGKKELSKLYGSKYSQSNLKGIYATTKKFLTEGKTVLFSGTPCQIVGLKSFLNKKYDRLITVDFICHGVPSPKVFRKYREFLEKENDSKISNINFRDKTSGWKTYSSRYEFVNGMTLKQKSYENIYMRAFLANISLRESCYNCKVKSLRSGSDITLGDYWGVENVHADFGDDKGTSLVIINTAEGKEIFCKINDKIRFVETNFEEAVKYNQCLEKSVELPLNRSLFFEKIDETDIVDLIQTCTNQNNM